MRPRSVERGNCRAVTLAINVNVCFNKVLAVAFPLPRAVTLAINVNVCFNEAAFS